MTKEELIHLTLKQLNESFRITPENFKLEDPEAGPVNNSFPGPTVIWQFRVELTPGTYIQDPLNASRTIIMTYNKLSNEITCHIYFREVNNIHHAISPECQATVKLAFWPQLNRSYREFMKLRNALLNKKREKEYFDYLKKLNSIFPSTHVDDIFK